MINQNSRQRVIKHAKPLIQLPRQIFSLLILLALQSCSFSSKTTKRLLQQAEKMPYDLIVVPGVPYEQGQWDKTMKGRVYWSKFLFDRGIAKNIMYSGSAVYSPYYESLIMAEYAKAIGIPSDHIFVEMKAEHSTENIYYSYQKARKLGFERIALASDPFQTKMLKRFVEKKLGPGVGLIPIVTDTLKVLEPQMLDPRIDDQIAFKKDFVSLKKREGFWKRLRGTRGLNIDTTAYK